MLSDPYVRIQIGQVLAWLICLTITHRSLKSSKIGWRRSPFLVICFGYYAASVASNLMRYLSNDRTVLSVMGGEDYLAGTLAWYGCLVVATAAYLVVRKRNNRNMQRFGAIAGVLRDSRLELIYVAIFLSGLIGYFANPFRSTDFGHLAPTSYNSILMGGLMVAGVCLTVANAGAVPLLFVRPALGIPCLTAIILLFTFSGSKALGAVFTLYVAAILYKSSPQRGMRTLRLALVPMCIYGAFLSLMAATNYRFKNSDATSSGAGAAAIGRFTHQEVFAVVWANAEWRSDMRERYLLGQLTSIVPGFLWDGKPRNPALEINQLYVNRGSPGAASPFVFGSLLLCTGSFGVFFVIPIFAGGMALLDAHICDLRRYPHLEWTYCFSIIMMVETVFLIPVIMLPILLWLRRALVRAETEYNRRSATRAGSGGVGRSLAGASNHRPFAGIKN